MRRLLLGLLPALITPLSLPARADEHTSKAAFLEVARVLQSPRCQNCHPADDRPRVGDRGRVHPQNVSRRIESLGLACTTCHQSRNTKGVHAPPGAPVWHLPPKATPMIFEGRTPGELCRQLKDPAQTNNRGLEALVEHVRSDALVLWGWAPGEGRTPPPLSHDDFVLAMERWVSDGAACPD
jgi:hypothetical protein